MLVYAISINVNHLTQIAKEVERGLTLQNTALHTYFAGGIFFSLTVYDWHTMLHLQLYFQGHTGESSVPGMTSLLHCNCSCSCSFL